MGVWTWSVGITDASGHRVGRYRDNPQPLERCLEVFLWLLTTRYLPAVLAAFGACEPTEPQLAAALSFHYNTGAITRASWLKRFLAEEDEAACHALLEWCHPPEILSRRRRERDLFFDAKWSGDGTVAVYSVAKPGYRPVRPKRVEVRASLERLIRPLGAGNCETSPSHDTPPSPAPECNNWFERLFD